MTEEEIGEVYGEIVDVVRKCEVSQRHLFKSLQPYELTS